MPFGVIGPVTLLHGMALQPGRPRGLRVARDSQRQHAMCARLCDVFGHELLPWSGGVVFVCLRLLLLFCLHGDEVIRFVHPIKITKVNNHFYSKVMLENFTVHPLENISYFPRYPTESFIHGSRQHLGSESEAVCLK